jgi:polyhydroxyalkanoate synthase
MKRNWWHNDAGAPDPDAWLAGATEVPGSWWPDWDAWLARHGGAQRPAPKAAGSRRHPPLAPAPGRYVLEKSL